MPQQRRILPPMIVLISLVVMVALHFLVPLSQIIPAPWTLLGIVPLVIGIGLNVSADALFHKAQTTVKPGEKSTALVTTGVFRLTRNPMYLGLGLVLAGVAVLLGTLTPFGMIPVFVVLIDRWFIRLEEQMLAATFGAAWHEYAQRTRRWL